jgi:membrane-bound ClpP family serine protease
LAGLATLGTLGFFWLVIRKAAQAQQAEPVFDPNRVLGKVGEARTALEPIGTVYVSGELWTAHAAAPIGPGTRVRVAKVNGLILEVVPAGEETPPGIGKEEARD